jgi:hypothetical protein
MAKALQGLFVLSKSLAWQLIPLSFCHQKADLIQIGIGLIRNQLFMTVFYSDFHNTTWQPQRQNLLAFSLYVKWQLPKEDMDSLLDERSWFVYYWLACINPFDDFMCDPLL